MQDRPCSMFDVDVDIDVHNEACRLDAINYILACSHLLHSNFFFPL